MSQSKQVLQSKKRLAKLGWVCSWVEGVGWSGGIIKNEGRGRGGERFVVGAGERVGGREEG